MYMKSCAPFPFLYYCLQRRRQLNSHPQVIKRGLFYLKKKKKRKPSGESWSVWYVFGLQSKSLLILTHREREGCTAVLWQERGEMSEKEICGNKGYGMPNPEMSGDDKPLTSLKRRQGVWDVSVTKTKQDQMVALF